MKKIIINPAKLIYLGLANLAIFSVVGSIVYYFYQFNFIGLAITISTATVFSSILSYYCLKHESSDNQHEQSNNPWAFKITALIYLLNYIVVIYLLLNKKTDASIISPWQVLPWHFWVGYFTLTLLLFALTWQAKNHLILLLICGHYFISFSIAIFIYKSGFGYDPFIHEATLDIISKHGFVLPKTPYYLSLYTPIILIHKALAVPIGILNKFFVPFLAGLSIPLTIYLVLKNWFNNYQAALLTTQAFLVLPFGLFIFTTPQNLGYLLLVLIVLLGLNCRSIFELIVIFLLSLMAFFAQPIAGIPSLFFGAFLLVFHKDNKKHQRLWYSLLFIASAISLPAAFYFLEKNTPGLTTADSVMSSWQAIKTFFEQFYFQRSNDEGLLLNLIYFYGFNIKLILVMLAGAGGLLAYRYREYCQVYSIYVYMILSLAIGFILTLKLPFSFLIKYERQDFADRILIVAGIFLLPFLILAVYSFMEKLTRARPAYRLFFTLVFACLISASLYISYPRFDHYFNSRGYSVSKSDIKAVQWINDNAKSDYIVLANQQVSVTALKLYGFNKYYKDDLFYYPIPTGGRLYQFYLDMVYEKPDRKTMLKAMDLAGVNKGYFVLNKYWWAFPKLLEEAKLEANTYENIDNGEVFIFEYKR